MWPPDCYRYGVAANTKVRALSSEPAVQPGLVVLITCPNTQLEQGLETPSAMPDSFTERRELF